MGILAFPSFSSLISALKDEKARMHIVHPSCFIFQLTPHTSHHTPYTLLPHYTPFTSHLTLPASHLPARKRFQPARKRLQPARKRLRPETPAWDSSQVVWSFQVPGPRSQGQVPVPRSKVPGFRSLCEARGSMSQSQVLGPSFWSRIQVAYPRF